MEKHCEICGKPIKEGDVYIVIDGKPHHEICGPPTPKDVREEM